MTIIKQIEYLERIAPRYARDTNEAKDLVQDTLYKSLTKRHLFKEGTNLKAWLATIMKNNFINGLRKKKRELSFGHHADMGHLSPQVEMTDDQWLLKEVWKGVEELPEGYSGPLKMYVQGYSYEDISKRYDAPIGTIKSRIFHARRRLKAKFANERQMT